MRPRERDQLIDDLIDGMISEADFIRLEAELAVDPAAREAYYRRTELSTLLELEEAAGAQPVEPQENVVPFPAWRSQLSRVAGIAALVAAIVTGGIGWIAGSRSQSPTTHGSASEPVAHGFGVVAEAVDAVWASGGRIDRGDLIPSGDLVLESGTVQLELFSGVTVMVAGKAQFSVHSPMEMEVVTGRVQALVPPPATGFRVRTANGDLVDLGTEFALDVTEDHSEVRVLDGEVEWHPGDDSERTVTEGESLRWADGKELPAGGVLEDAAGLRDLERTLSSDRLRRKALWNERSASLAEDPRTLAYYPINPDSILDGRVLADRSGNGRDGTIVQARPVADRWGTPDAALDFAPTGSRVRLNIPGKHPSLTLLCWAKIDSLDRWYNSLFLTDGHELHEPHWQIMDDGRLFFSVKAQNGKPDKHIAYSPAIWSPAMSGRWVQLAVVYDRAAATTTHYLNGDVLGRDTLPEAMRVDLVSIGDASIGNWSEPKRDDPEFAVRNLNGSIDEFAIFGAALSQDEIADLYEIGHP